MKGRVSIFAYANITVLYDTRNIANSKIDPWFELLDEKLIF